MILKDGSDGRWGAGDRPDDIRLEDLILFSIHNVSLGSWQPFIRLRQPPPISAHSWLEGLRSCYDPNYGSDSMDIE